MKKLLTVLASVALLASCASVPEQNQALVGALSVEAAIAVRCPRNNQELNVVTQARLVIDLRLRPQLNEEQNRLVDLARAETNRRCGLVTVPLAVPESDPRLPGENQADPLPEVPAPVPI